MNEAVLYEVQNEIATITLNRPASLNAMNNDLLDGLVNALRRVTADTSVRTVILTGAGRGFCSGADLTEQWDWDAGMLPSADLVPRLISRFRYRRSHECRAWPPAADLGLRSAAT